MEGRKKERKREREKRNGGQSLHTRVWCTQGDARKCLSEYIRRRTMNNISLIHSFSLFVSLVLVLARERAEESFSSV